MSRLKANTTVIRDYTWDDQPLESLTREELLEAVKMLALEAQSRQSFNPLLGQGGAVFAEPLLVVDAFASQRQALYASPSRLFSNKACHARNQNLQRPVAESSFSR